MDLDAGEIVALDDQGTNNMIIDTFLKGGLSVLVYSRVSLCRTVSRTHISSQSAGTPRTHVCLEFRVLQGHLSSFLQ